MNKMQIAVFETERVKLLAKVAATKTSLDAAVSRAKQRVVALKIEAGSKAESLKEQLAKAKGDARARLEDRVKRVKSAYDARGATLSQTWALAKEAPAV